jgi:hypothetical protein
MSQLPLPKAHFSYNQWKMWTTNKKQYRDIYYKGGSFHVNEEMIFGKKIAEMLENDDPQVAFIPRLAKQEHKILTHVGDVPFLGYVDSFDPETKAFDEKKTGHVTSTGKPPWDIVKVYKWRQLDVYSLLIKLTEGKVKNRCTLTWIETEKVPKSIIFDGHQLTTDGFDLRMTGRIEIFERVITQVTRDQMYDDIIKAANEIRLDYAEFKKYNS